MFKKRLSSPVNKIRSTREAKVKRFTLFYVKRETARWRLPFHVNAMLNLSIEKNCLQGLKRQNKLFANVIG